MNKIAIGEVCNVYDGPHATPTKIEKGPIYLGIDAITDSGKINPAGYNYLSDEDYVKWTKRVTPQYGDIVFSYEATLGRYALIPKEFYGCLGRRLAIVRPKDERINVKWLFYYFRSTEWSVFIKNNTVKGSTVDRISVEDFPKYKIPLVNREKQDKIVAVLSAIDDKIDNNQTINDNLEQMANQLFEHWFVQFKFPPRNNEMSYNDAINMSIPANWSATTVSELLGKVPNTLRIQSSEYATNGELPIVDQSSNFIAGYTNMQDSLLYDEHGYIVFGDHTRVVKYIRFPFARGADGTQIMKSDLKNMPTELFYQIVKHIDLSNHGYARHFKFLKESVVVVPDEKTAQLYANTVIPWHEKQVNIQIENRKLVQLRDWLLPMLMNGQATIGD